MTKDELNKAIVRSDSCKARLVIKMKEQINSLQHIMDDIMMYSPESQDCDWYNKAVTFVDVYEATLASILEEYQLHYDG